MVAGSNRVYFANDEFTHYHDRRKRGGTIYLYPVLRIRCETKVVIPGNAQGVIYEVIR